MGYETYKKGIEIAEGIRQKIFNALVGVLLIQFFVTLTFRGIIFLVTGQIVTPIEAMSIRIWSILAVITFFFMMFVLTNVDWNMTNLNFPTPPYAMFTGIIIIAALYATILYPFLPVAMGGGRPIPIQLISEPEKTQIVEKIIPLGADGVSESLFLLDQSESSYFVLLPIDQFNSEVIPLEVNKELFIGLLHPSNIPVASIITPTPTETPMPTISPTETPIPTLATTSTPSP